MDEWHKLWDEEDRKMTEQRIEAARKQGKIYDVDRLFWDGGKLFGYDTYYVDYKLPNGKTLKAGPLTTIKREITNGKLMGLVNVRSYDIKFTFDWNMRALSLLCCSFNPYTSEPTGIGLTITFDMLFGVKPEIVKVLIDTEIEKLIRETDKMIDDGKKDNRDC